MNVNYAQEDFTRMKLNKLVVLSVHQILPHKLLELLLEMLVVTDVEWVRVKWPYVTAMPTACSLKKLMDIPVNVRLDTLAMEVMEIALIIVWITAEMRAFVSRTRREVPIVNVLDPLLDNNVKKSLNLLTLLEV